MPMSAMKKPANPTDHLANDRTFLAWVRTGIGIMAFGFVVVKFSLFVKQIALLLDKGNMIQSRSYSEIVGIVLVAMGTVTVILAYIRYRQIEKQLKEGYYAPSSLLITVLTAFIFLVSILLIVYLVKTT
jgi:putative membrane protein